MQKKTLRGAILAIAALAAIGLSGCGGIDKNAIAENAAKPGSAMSGTLAVINDPGNIPHVPASNGQSARWSQDEADQAFYADAVCQEQLYKQLPSSLKSMVAEAGWGALSTGAGKGLFAKILHAAVPGYAEGGAAIGGLSGANTGRILHAESVKVALSTCQMELISMWQNRYHILSGQAFVPWVDPDTKATLLTPYDPTTKAPLPYVPYGSMAPAAVTPQ